MIIDPRAAALNEVAAVCHQLASHYEEDAEEVAGDLAQHRAAELLATVRLLNAQVDQLGELPRAADADKETLAQLADQGKAALSDVTGGAIGKPLSQSLVEREQQLEAILRDVLAQTLEPALDCAASDLLEAAVVQSERARARLADAG